MKVNKKIYNAAQRFIEELATEPVKVLSFMEDEQTFVCKDEDDNIVFVRVIAGYDEFPEETPRTQREEIMCKWMHSYDEGEALVRFNELSFAIMNNSRALVRYEIAAH